MQSVGIEQFVGRNVENYRIDRLLGQGPVSSFYEAHHSSGQSAILTLFDLPATFSLQARTRFLARFRQEGAALVELKHPAILPVLGYGEFVSYLYLATPFVTGNSLAQVLQARGPMPYEVVLVVLKQIAEGLDYAHSRKAVHGALSPANILVGSGGVQIAGFGIARILAMQGLEPQVPRHAHQLNIAERFLGLPDYMAPEVVLGEPFSASADIFALGVLLFELLSGRPPFSGETPFDVAEQYLLLPAPSLSAQVPALPASVDTVVRKALSYSSEQRFQSAGEFVRAFEQALQPQQVDGQQPTRGAQNAASAGSFATVGKQPDAIMGMLQIALPGADPFAWWSSASMTEVVSRPHMGSHVSSGRRRAVALLSAGAIAAVGLGGGGFALEHYLQTRQKVAPVANIQSQSRSQVSSPTVSLLTQQPTAISAPTLAAKPSATVQPATPTSVPKPTPTPASSPSSSSKGKGKGKGKGGKKG